MRVTCREDEKSLNLGVQLLLWIDTVDIFSEDFIEIWHTKDATDLAIFGQASAIRMIVQFSYLIFRITEEEIPRRR
jgi:hypothetical protein